MSTRDKGARNGAAADYIRGLKAAQKLTTRELAEASGVPYEMLVRILGNRAAITLDHFADLANALGVSDEDSAAALRKIVFQD